MKACIKCGVTLTKDNTKPYHIKNYIHKCSECLREEKRVQASHIPKSKRAESSQNHHAKVRGTNPVLYTCRQMAGSAKKRAAAYSFEFDITADFLASRAPVTCPVLGVVLKYGGGPKSRYSASLDRIDSNRGYTTDNVWIISNLANMMKNQADRTELDAFADWVKSLPKEK